MYLNNIFNNGFTIFKLHEDLTEGFTKNKNSKSELYSIIWVTEGMVDLLVDDLMVQINANQMIFITPFKEVKIIENFGQVKILIFNRPFYCIRENDHEVSCEGILYFGAQGVPRIDLDIKQLQSFNRLWGRID